VRQTATENCAAQHLDKTLQQIQGKSAAAKQAMDAINKRFGRETLRIASTGNSRAVAFGF